MNRVQLSKNYTNEPAPSTIFLRSKKKWYKNEDNRELWIEARRLGCT
jgi:hypothetical protein